MFAPTLRGFANELRRLALAQDHRTLMTPRENDPKSLRAAAAELQQYAREVRARGGIFKLSAYQLVAGAVILIAAFAWGCSLVCEYWDGSMLSFFGGVFLIVSAAGLGFGLVKSQRQAA